MRLNIPLTVDSKGLAAQLAAIDLSVPGRTEGRTTHHTETWTICRLLSTLDAAHLLKFPVSVIHQDKPDFLIKDGSKEAGVEVTEAISQQYAAYCALAEREFPDALLEPSHFRWDSTERTVEEMRALLRQTRLSSEGWDGDAPEKEWAFFMQSTVDSKLTKLACEDFSKYERNYLAIYDNLPMPSIHLGNAISHLCLLLKDCWSRTPAFDVIFIEHGPVIARLTVAGSENLLLKSLWE